MLRFLARDTSGLEIRITSDVVTFGNNAVGISRLIVGHRCYIFHNCREYRFFRE